MTNLAAETQAYIAKHIVRDVSEEEYVEAPAVISHDSGYVTMTQGDVESASTPPRPGRYVEFVGPDLNGHQVYVLGNALIWRGETIEEMARNLAADLGNAVYRAA